MERDFLKRHAKTIRAVAVCACALLLAVASVAALRRPAAPRAEEAQAVSAEAVSDPEDAMASFRLEREQLRSMQTAQLNEMIHSSDTDEETRRLARQRLLLLGDWMEKETTVEGILRMRGYEDAICTVHDDSVNVVIRAQTVGRQESAVIYELVLRETGVTGGNVKIVPVG